MKSTHWGVILLVKWQDEAYNAAQSATPPWVLCTYFEFLQMEPNAQSASYYLGSFRTLVSFIIFYAHLNNYIEKDTFSLSNKTVYLVKNYLLFICHKKKQYCTSFFTDYGSSTPRTFGWSENKKEAMKWVLLICLFTYCKRANMQYSRPGMSEPGIVPKKIQPSF